MGGQLYLNDGQLPSRSNVCVSGYERGTPNFALSNFEDNDGNGYDFHDPKLGKIHFPTSEHYLHFQKIHPDHKAHYYNLWKNASPGEILKGISNVPADHLAYKKLPNGKGLDPQWDDDKKWVQMQINAAKYQQSAKFRQSIQHSIDLGNAMGDGEGPATIIEDTSSLQYSPRGPEVIWGTGPDGSGTNILGNTQTAFAKMVQDGLVPKGVPKLGDFQSPQIKAMYKKADDQYQGGVQKVLSKVRERSGHDKGFGQPDTSNLHGSLVQTADIVNGKIAAKQFLPSPGPQHHAAPQHPGPQHKAPQGPQGPQAPKATSQIPHQYCVENKDSTKRLLINNEKIVGYQFKRPPSDRWENTGTPERLNDIKNAFNNGGKYYVTFDGGNKRLGIDNNKVVERQYKDVSTGWKWQDSSRKDLFAHLENTFNRLHQASPPRHHQANQQKVDDHYTSKNGNQRLLIKDNKVVGYQYKDTTTGGQWKDSGDKTRFTALENKYILSKIPHQYCVESNGGNQRLIINNNKVEGYLFRKDPSSPWQTGKKEDMKGLENAFNNGGKYFVASDGGNQRLLINNNKVEGHMFRKDPASPWQTGGKKDMQGLEQAFKDSKAATHAPLHHAHYNNGSKPSSAQENMDVVSKYYAHATKSNDDNRFHLFDVSSEHFHDMKGDFLKTKILSEFHKELSKCTDVKKFDAMVNSIVNNNEAYDILKTGQGIITKITGGETSSVTAFKEMVKDLRSKLPDSDDDQDKIVPVY